MGISHSTRQSGVSQNTKHLTIKQIKALIANNGVVENIDKAIAQKRPTEYCLDALNAALLDKQAKANHKYQSSPDYITDQINAALNATTIFPPKMPASYTKTAPVSKPAKKSFTFNFGAPLWQVEKLTLDQRLAVFTKGA